MLDILLYVLALFGFISLCADIYEKCTGVRWTLATLWRWW